VLGKQTVQCAEGETTIFNAPDGQTCAQYAADWVRSAGPGYLTNPEATSDCGYCQYANGEEYLATINVSPDDKWRDFGIFLVFCFSNWALVYFFIYTTRVKGWSFGMSTLFGSAGKMIGSVKGLFRKKKQEQGGDEKAV
jgi:ATP-binding cassette, subfamily G (WHITE), member 2, SNQ2